MEEEILDRMLNVLNIHGLNYANVKSLENDMTLKEDLIFDSLDITEYLMGIEDEFNIGDIDSNIVFITVDDIRKYIEEKI